MDHSTMDHSTMNHNAMDHHAMGHSMSFHFGYEEELLFSGNKVNTYSSFVGACIVIVVVGALTPIFYVFCSQLESTIGKMAIADGTEEVSTKLVGDQLPDKAMNTRSPRSSKRFSKWSLIYPLFILTSRMVYFTLGYMLMLVAMTFNVTLFLCTVLGLALGTTIVKILITPDKCYFRRTDPQSLHEENRDAGICCC